MMTVQASKTATVIDEIDLDAPIFDSRAFRLNDEQAGIIAAARELGFSGLTQVVVNLAWE